MKRTFMVCFLVLTVLVSCGESDKQTSSASSVILELRKYGNTVAAATDGVVIFVSAYQTTKTPMNGYCVTSAHMGQLAASPKRHFCYF